jgi:8-oxo-dGTP pyrophosphatase MutT (NUDIX family)
MRNWSVVSGIVERDGALLLVANLRRNGAVDWSPPGGVIEEGEDEVDALTREVVEETGLVVDEWTGPVYEVAVDLGERGGNLRVIVYRAVSHSGEFVFDDPDGIVFDAGFHHPTACHAYLDDAPHWVAEPLRDWLAAPWDDLRRYDYRVVHGTTLASLVVERL